MCRLLEAMIFLMKMIRIDYFIQSWVKSPMEYLLLLLLAELFEVFIQRSETLLGVLQKLYVYYQKSIFLLALKVFDMFYKIELIKKVFIEREVSQEIAQMLEWNIPPWFFLMGIGMYVPLLYFALL